MRLATLVTRFPRAARMLLSGGGILFLMFLVGLAWLSRSLPEEGIKLHANVDTGVDMLGTRQDLLWIAVLGTAVFVGNSVLAWILAPREHAAMFFLLGATIPVLLLLLGSLVFLAGLNRIR